MYLERHRTLFENRLKTRTAQRWQYSMGLNSSTSMVSSSTIDSIRDFVSSSIAVEALRSVDLIDSIQPVWLHRFHVDRLFFGSVVRSVYSESKSRENVGRSNGLNEKQPSALVSVCRAHFCSAIVLWWCST